MIEAVTASVVANLVRMLRTAKKETAVCIVEGADDKKRFKSFFDETRVGFVIAYGWEKAVKALDLVETTGYPGVLAIIDADHRRVEQAFENSSKNLFYSDFHDFEIDLIETSAFDRLISELCDSDKKKHPPSQEIKKRLAEVALPLGGLRLYNTRRNLFLKFSTLSYSSFIDEETLSVDRLAMVREVKNRSQRHDLDDNALLVEVDKVLSSGYDYRLLCRGHDLIAILSLSLRRCYAGFSAKSSNEVSPPRLEQMLRMSYQREFFEASSLYQSLVDWQLKNSPFGIFTSPPKR